jgi:thiol-disulfide isomerase/thioredoxin
VCIATIGALVAGLVASVLLSEEDDGAVAQQGELEPIDAADPEAMLAVGLTTVDGKPDTLAAHLDGRPMVLNLWAWSCVPCIDEMPLLEAAHQENAGLAFFGVHVNDPGSSDQLAKAQRLAEQTGITFPWAQDADRNFFFEANAAGMPTTLLLDGRGRILATKTGAFADRSELQGWIDRHQPTP